jgi:two-component system chemotaxis response regulator CheY
VPPAPKSILVIDDSAAIREQVRAVLGPAGYDVIEARDGLEGMEKIRANRDLALVLCDLTMPGMGGLAVVQACQNAGLTVPFLILTSDGQPAVIRRARDAGVKGWIVKPIKPDMLKFAVDKILAADPAAMGAIISGLPTTHGRS